MTCFLRLSTILAVLCAPVWAQVSPDINVQPSRAWGHERLNLSPQQTTSPNLLEGRELNSPTAIAFDTSVSPAIVYVADTGNHRVLAWRNPAALTRGDKADKVIGQRDFTKAFPGGPGSTGEVLTAAGMTLPNAVAVDSSGNLFVLDAGNNRILRFPRPLDQQGEIVTPDMVIGQKTVSSGVQSNQGQPKPSEKTLSFNRAGAVSRGGMAFDPEGNLWVADSLNHRVLRFPKGRLNANEPAADLVLGQNTFDTDTSGNTQNDFVHFLRPTSLAFDGRGGLFVTDAVARVVYYDTLVTGANMKRILGIQPAATQAQPRPPAPNDYTIGQIQTGQGIAQCVFTIEAVPFVCDTVANRVVRFASADQWPAPTNDSLSPQIQSVYGQDTLFLGGINRGNGGSKPSLNSFYAPVGGAFYNNEMWVVDAGNNRVLVFAQNSPNFTFGGASRLLGQLDYDLNAPNLVDGRELYIFDPSFHGSGIAIDRTSTPNHLYIADSQNNRILGFRDVRSIGTDRRTPLTQTADIVIGQPDRFRTGVNYPSGDPLIPTDQGLFTPTGVAVDAQGNLWVADTNNGRVLRFPAPFNQPGGEAPRANLVLGQSNFSNQIKDPSSSTMAAPFGVAVFNNGDLAVSDNNHNRVLLFRKSGADFVNGQAARAVLGQQNFSSTGASSSASGLNRPRGLAVDSSDRLYVADTSNGRVIVYSSTATTPNGATGTSIPGLNTPEGVAVSPSTGEVWVAAYGSNAVYRFREFTQLGANPTSTAGVSSVGPMAIALDQFDNIISAEAVNRMTFFYARMVYRHAATYASGSGLAPTLTPGMYTLAARSGKDFEFTPESGSIPYAKTLGGLQVLVDGVPAPITSLTNNIVYFLVPNNAPTSGEAEFLITRPATGEILAAATFTMGPAAPGFFTANQQGNRQIAATNEDGKPNSSANPVGQDQLLTLWLTGYGHLDNAPPDGEAPGSAFDIPNKPVITIGGTYTVPPEKLLYSGLSPEYPGLWQINIRMPKNGEPGAPAPSNNLPILIRMLDVPSNIGGTSAIGVDQIMNVPNGLITTIAFK